MKPKIELSNIVMKQISAIIQCTYKLMWQNTLHICQNKMQKINVSIKNVYNATKLNIHPTARQYTLVNETIKDQILVKQI